MELIAITSEAQPARVIANLPECAVDVLKMTAQTYENHGFAPPWIGYLGVKDGVCVGACGFKTAPQNGAVEIAYYTFPQHEGRGIATRMAKHLIDIARVENPSITVAAQTLPVENASNHILRKLGFAFDGELMHAEDGKVWQWTLTKGSTES